jgi:hypothetical protein
MGLEVECKPLLLQPCAGVTVGLCGKIHPVEDTTRRPRQRRRGQEERDTAEDADEALHTGVSMRMKPLGR